MDGLKLPLRIHDHTDASFEIADAAGRRVAFVYYDEDRQRRLSGKLLDRTCAMTVAQTVARAVSERFAAPEPADAEVDAILGEFDHDARAAIKGLLHDLDVVARDAERAVSRGYVRGRLFRRRQRSE
jgi:hypothetical protein